MIDSHIVRYSPPPVSCISGTHDKVCRTQFIFSIQWSPLDCQAAADWDFRINAAVCIRNHSLALVRSVCVCILSPNIKWTRRNCSLAFIRLMHSRGMPTGGVEGGCLMRKIHCEWIWIYNSFIISGTSHILAIAVIKRERLIPPHRRACVGESWQNLNH